MLTFNSQVPFVDDPDEEHLNTSHVNLQPELACQADKYADDLNTSHVNLQRCLNLAFSSPPAFKYISC